jgi:drug/metabolite transporter (DMT)-like permease
MSFAGFLYAIAAAIMWGAAYTIDQKVLIGLSPASLLFVDSVLTTLLVSPLALVQSSVWPLFAKTPIQLGGLVLVSAILAVLANFFILSSIRVLGASTASIFEIAYPFFVALFTYLAFGSKLNAYFFGGAFLIFIGAAIIPLHPRKRSQDRSLLTSLAER